jgi:glycine/D-amino acid oxidase-like deaminating enzyme
MSAQRVDKLSEAVRALEGARFFPFWLDDPDRPQPAPALAQDIDTDLLIVGGGFTGLWAGLQAKEQRPERDVVLIEADAVATGATGRPGAILSTSLMHGMANSARLFGSEMVELERLGKENMDAFRDTIERYEIACDVEWTGELTVAVGQEGIGEVEAAHALYRQYGHDAHLLDREQVQQELNAPLFHAGLWSKQRAGIINPAKLAWGLKRAAQSLGVRFYENTPMVRSRRAKASIEVDTDRARITAERVLLATNAFTRYKRKIAARVASICDRIIVTEPLTHDQLADLGWRNRQGIYDTRTQLNYLRLTGDNRVLFGGRLGYFFGNNTDPDEDRTPAPYLRLVSAFYETLPALRGIPISHAWSGPIALTTRMAVHYQSYHGARMLYAGGYSGFGVTASRFAARVALAILEDRAISERRLSFVQTLPAWLPPEPLRWLGAQITMYALDTCDEKGGWRKLWLALVDRMGFPLKP